MRNFHLGDRVVCTTSGIYGRAILFYTPTGQEEQTMIFTDDGRKYHAPTSEWAPEGKIRGCIDEPITASLLSEALGKSFAEFAETAHEYGLSLSEAAEAVVTLSKQRIRLYVEN